MRHGPNLRAVLAAAKTGALTTSEKSPDSLSSSNAASSADAHGIANTTTAGAVAAAPSSSAPDLPPPTSSSPFDLQAHPSVLAVLREACAAPRMALDPSLPGDRIVARDVGAFVSRPGAADQP